MNDRTIARLLLALALGFMLAFSWRAFTNADAGLDGGTNAIRNEHGLAPLAVSSTLTDLANQRAAQIVDNFAHDFWWWGASGCAGIGENLHWRSPDGGVDHALQAWYASPGHKANLLGDWQMMGSARLVLADGSGYYVQLFGKDCTTDEVVQPKPPPQPTPPPPPVPVQNPPVVQPPKPPVVLPPAPVQLPDTSMEKP